MPESLCRPQRGALDQEQPPRKGATISGQEPGSCAEFQCKYAQHQPLGLDAKAFVFLVFTQLPVDDPGDLVWRCTMAARGDAFLCLDTALGGVICTRITRMLLETVGLRLPSNHIQPWLSCPTCATCMFRATSSQTRQLEVSAACPKAGKKTATSPLDTPR